MDGFERFRFQDFPWLDKDFPATMEYLEKEKNRELGIYLGEKGINTEMLDSLLNLADSNKFMDALMLDNNNLTDEGAKRLAEYLKTDTKLKYLFLEKNNITNEGMKYILDALKENNTLKSLWLGRNHIDDDGIAEFSQFLIDKPQLREFSIGGAEMRDDGAIYLARALNADSTNMIKNVHLLDNEISTEGAMVLAEVASRDTGAIEAIEVHSKDCPASKFADILKTRAETEARHAFETALRNNEQGPWLRCKIMVVGQGRAGKTATVRSMLNLPFSDALDSTVGAEIKQSTTKKNRGQGAWEQEAGATKVNLALDAATRLAKLRMQRKKNEHTEMMKNLSIDELREKFKAERMDRERAEEAKKVAMENIIPDSVQEEINSKFKAELVTNKDANLEDISFTIWDYGGQKVFYTLHHLFLTKYGVYILVFDMRDVICPKETDPKKINEKRKECTEYLEFWLNSVYMHAAEAPLMIVGTFLDKVKSTDSVAKVNAFLEKLIDNKFPQIVMNGKLSYFPLSNYAPGDEVGDVAASLGGKAGPNIDTIRDTIEEVSRKQDFVNQNLSLKWVKCLDDMLELTQDSIKLDEALKIGSRCGISSEEEMMAMLKFFHELGMIVHIDSTQHLRDIVTLKPQWLINELAKVIRDKALHMKDVNTAELEKRGLKDSFDLMMKQSIVTLDWLEYLWPKNKVNFLIDLMKRTMLISEWKFGEFAKEVAYLVPSLIDNEDEKAMDVPKAMLVQFNGLPEDEKAEGEAKKEKGGVGQKMKGLLKVGKGKKKAGEKGDDLEEENEAYFSQKKEKVELPKGFYSPSKDTFGIVFDFSKSFLPNGVFQRILCLCILKCSSDMKAFVPPQLSKYSAVITMSKTQTFTIYQYERQILCTCTENHLESYKVLSSMMMKLKTDVMGTGLEWDEYLETVDLSDRVKTENVEHYLHKFVNFNDVREQQAAPWFHQDLSEQEERVIEKKMGIELEQFLQDLSEF